MNIVGQPGGVSVKLVGYLCGLGFIAIWSGFIVFARLGVTGNLTPYDITALRFLVSSLVTLPFVVFHWPRHLSLGKILLLALIGPGAVYSVLIYSGLDFSPAAFAGVFANATMPIFTALFAWLWLGERLTRSTGVAIAVILIGAVSVAYQSFNAANASNLTGLPFFIAGSVSLAAYVVLLRRSRLTTRQTLAIINLPNALVFLPIWFFFLPSTLGVAGIDEILLQALFQGLGPGFFGLIFFTYAIQTLGPTPVAGFAAVVPATATLLAIPVLGETLNLIEWGGVVIVTGGLALLLLKK